MIVPTLLSKREAIRFKLLLGDAPAPPVGLFLVGAYEDQPMSPGRFYDERVVWCFMDNRAARAERRAQA